jgi:hypothetical protein
MSFNDRSCGLLEGKGFDGKIILVELWETTPASDGYWMIYKHEGKFVFFDLLPLPGETLELPTNIRSWFELTARELLESNQLD